MRVKVADASTIGPPMPPRHLGCVRPGHRFLGLSTHTPRRFSTGGESRPVSRRATHAGLRQPVTIIIADLNGLKVANDQYGHSVGDTLLRRAGEVLNALIERPNYAARIGGDEFAVLCPAWTRPAARR